jgi:DNA adenine methylase
MDAASKTRCTNVQADVTGPFLKWPGGKRWLVPWLKKFIGELPFDRYFEPFLGGGALFFALRPRRAVLSDINPDLINVYKQAKLQADLIVEKLKTIPVTARTYARLRHSIPEDSVERAVRFLYLNRTAFSGIYRLNREGRFNVPYGGGDRTTEPLWRDELLAKAARRLQRARLISDDFESVLEEAGAGDLVYCDPTYTVAHNNNGFIRYNERNFAWDDQKRLALCCRRLARRGATVIVSNADHADIVELFRPELHFTLERNSLLCPDIDKRRTVQEVVMVFGKGARTGRKPKLSPEQ